MNQREQIDAFIAGSKSIDQKEADVDRVIRELLWIAQGTTKITERLRVESRFSVVSEFGPLLFELIQIYKEPELYVRCTHVPPSVMFGANASVILSTYPRDRGWSKCTPSQKLKRTNALWSVLPEFLDNMIRIVPEIALDVKNIQNASV